MLESDTCTSPPLIVAGMHRSGTSLTAATLQSAGLFLGDRLLPSGRGNARGHFENLDILHFHEQVLIAQGQHPVGWTVDPEVRVPPEYGDRALQLVAESAGRGKVWGWKEPRTTLFLEFWHQVLPSARFVIVFRAPWEVLDSLYRRDEDAIFAQQPEFALRIWTHYDQRALDFHRRHRDSCVLVEVDRVAASPKAFVTQLAEMWDLPLTVPSEAVFQPELLHACPERAGLLAAHYPEAIALYRELQGVALDAGRAGNGGGGRPESVETSARLVLRDWQLVRQWEHLLEDGTETRQLWEYQQVRLRELQQAQDWLRVQWQVHRERAEQSHRDWEAAQSWIRELEAAKTWLEEQCDYWQTQAKAARSEREELEHLRREWEAAQSWMRELEAAKTWSEEQRDYWQARAEIVRSEQDKASSSLPRTSPSLWKVCRDRSRQSCLRVWNRLTGRDSSEN